MKNKYKAKVIYERLNHDIKQRLSKDFLTKHKRCGLSFCDVTGRVCWNQPKDLKIIFPGSWDGHSFLPKHQHDQSLFNILFINGYKYLGELETVFGRKAIWELGE